MDFHLYFLNYFAISCLRVTISARFLCLHYLHYWLVLLYIYATCHLHVPVILMKMCWEYVVCSACVVHRCSSVSSYQFFRECHQLPFFLLVYITSPLESFMLVVCKEFMFFLLTLFALISNSLITWVMVVWVKCNGLLVAVYSLVCCSCGPSELLTGYCCSFLKHVVVIWCNVRCNMCVCARWGWWGVCIYIVVFCGYSSWWLIKPSCGHVGQAALICKA